HADPAVAGGLDRLDLAHPHVHRQPTVLVAADLGLAGAGRARPGEQAFGDRGQRLQAFAAVVDETGFDGIGVQWTILSGCVDATKKPANSWPPAAAPTGARRWTCWNWANGWWR